MAIGDARKGLKWYALQAIAALLYLPWVPNVVRLENWAAQRGGLVGRNPVLLTNWPDFGTLWGVLLFNRHIIFILLLATFLIFILLRLVAARSMRKRSLQTVGLLTNFLVVSTGLAFLLNAFLPIIVERRMIFLLVGIVALTGYAISVWPRSVGIVALVAVAGLSLTAQTPARLPGGNVRFRQIVESLEDIVQPYDVVYVQLDRIIPALPIQYYAQQLLPEDTVAVVKRDLVGQFSFVNDYDRAYFANELFADYVWTRDRFWIVRPRQPEFGGPPELEWIQFIEGKEFVETETFDSYSMTISLFTATSPDKRTIPPSAIALPERQPLPVTFGKTFELLDYGIDRITVRPGEEVTIWLDWRALRPPDYDYTIYVHLYQNQQTLVGQADGYPSQLGRPIATSYWSVDTIIYDTRLLTIPTNAAAGSYQIKIGIYRQDNLQRLPALLSDSTIDDGLVLATLEVR